MHRTLRVVLAAVALCSLGACALPFFGGTGVGAADSGGGAGSDGVSAGGGGDVDASVGDMPQPANIVEYLPFDGTQGAIGDGALIPAVAGGAGVAKSSALSYVTGERLQAISFPGTGSVAFPKVAENTLGAGTAYSVAMWIYPTTVGGDFTQALLTDAQQQAPWTGHWLLYGSTWCGAQVIALNIAAADSSGGIAVYTNATVPLNAWTYVVATYDGSSRASGVRIYLDGAPADTTVYANDDHLDASSVSTPSDWTIGSSVDGSDNFTGSIDDVVVWNGVLSSSEVATLYTLGE